MSKREADTAKIIPMRARMSRLDQEQATVAAIRDTRLLPSTTKPELSNNESWRMARDTLVDVSVFDNSFYLKFASIVQRCLANANSAVALAKCVEDSIPQLVLSLSFELLLHKRDNSRTIL